MEFKTYFRGSDLRFDDINNIEKYIKELDDKNNNLTVDDITYALIDIIDDEIIEIKKIEKIYKLDKVYPRTYKEKVYITYKIDILVQFLNKDKIKEYCDFRDDFFYEVMSEIHGHRILNRVCSKHSHFVTVDSSGRRIYDRRPWDAPVDEFDEFDLHPNKVVWIDNSDINNLEIE